MQTKVSVRWQTVIPKGIRKALNIAPGSQLNWELKDGFIVVCPLCPDPVKASLGLLRGRVGTSTLLSERKLERERER